MTETPNPAAAVIQADRELACRFLPMRDHDHRAIRAGEVDYLPAIQMLARHRLASCAPQPPEGERESERALREALEAAQVQLEKAANQFAFYADAHAKKGTKDGDLKGATNHQWALACAKADHQCRAALSATGGSRAQGIAS